MHILCVAHWPGVSILPNLEARDVPAFGGASRESLHVLPGSEPSPVGERPKKVELSAPWALTSWEYPELFL